MSEFYTNCLDNAAAPGACTTWEQQSAANASCGACLVTSELMPIYGPLVQRAIGVVEINVAGCIALLEPCNVECAKAYQSHAECQTLACGSCTVTDATNLIQYQQCTTKSDLCGCQPYEISAACSGQLTGTSHASEICITGGGAATFQQYYLTVAPIFCGQ
jgi:hypothetical protein